MSGSWVDKLFHLGKEADRTALVVDDDRDIVGLLTFHLSKLGFDVLPSETPKTAINYVKKRKRRIHLLVMDVRMPEKNGPTLARELRKFRPAALAPILFISGAYSQSELKKLTESFRSSYVLHKPFTTMEFFKAVEDIVPRSAKSDR